MGQYHVEADLFYKKYIIRRGNKAVFAGRGWADRAEKLAKIFSQYDDNFIDELCELVTILDNFGLIKFRQRLFDTELSVLHRSIKQIIPTIFMYQALGLRSIIEVQIYKALSKPPIRCYSVQDVFIGRTSCEVRFYMNDDKEYLRLKIEDFRPRVEYWRYNSNGFYRTSWPYVKHLKDDELFVRKLHFTALAKALLTLSDNPTLACWRYIIEHSSKVHLPQGVKQLIGTNTT
jgi:hypothetical protein